MPQLNDAVVLLNYLYRGDRQPNDPFPPDCGADADSTLFECPSYVPSCSDFPGPNLTRRWPLDQEETTVAVNPCHPDNIVVFSNHTTPEGGPGGAANGPGLFRAVSFDGGASWPVRGIILATGSYRGNADPTAAFDAYGNLYFAYNGFCPSSLRLAVSTDGGVTFPSSLRRTVFEETDKPTIATGPSSGGFESVWISFHAGQPSPDLYAVGARVTGPIATPSDLPRFTSYHIDPCPCNDGTICPLTAGVSACGNGNIAIGPAGDVMVVYQDTTHGFAPHTSCRLNIGTATNPVGVNPVYVKYREAAPPGDLSYQFHFPTEMPIATTKVCGPSDRGGGEQLSGGAMARPSPLVQWDRGADRVYLAYSREPLDGSEDIDLYLRVGFGPSSFTEWSTPVAVDDSRGLQTWHAMSVIRSADPALNGRVVLGWYGTGDLVPGSTVDYYATYSIGVDPSRQVPIFKRAYKVSSCASPAGIVATGNDYTSLACRDDGVCFAVYSAECPEGGQQNLAQDVVVKRFQLEVCDDGMDNDGDGRTDCLDPACCGIDPQCPGVPENCQDGADNDCNGLVDCDDPACCGVDPTCPACEDCGNGQDDDGDGLVDCADPGCARDPLCTEDCANAGDEDGDGLADCADPDCEPSSSCLEDCTNHMDDDSDGLPDCSDPECAGQSCPEICDNGVDDDVNGLTDCADPECFSQPDKCLGETCDDGMDNDDGDGLVDCADPECFAQCVEVCDNGVDDDSDGLADCADLQCYCLETCDNGVDDDVDGLVDCADPECAEPDCSDDPDCP